MYCIREILKIGSEHKQCEDSIFKFEKDDFIYIATFDGCSGGIDSHFASSLFKKILRKSIKIVDFNRSDVLTLDYKKDVYYIMWNFIGLLNQSKLNLQLEIDEILSTIIFAMVNKKNRDGYLMISGDGAFCLNGELTSIDQNNQPDYISYYSGHITSVSPSEMDKIFDTFNTYQISNINDLSVMSDGIFSYRKDGQNVSEIVVQKFLKEDKFIKSEAMLPRVRNILDKDGFYHYDDLSIVRLIFDEKIIVPKEIVMDRTNESI